MVAYIFPTWSMMSDLYLTGLCMILKALDFEINSFEACVCLLLQE